MSEPAGNPGSPTVRLQKIIAQAGIVSRRKAEELILDGRVQVKAHDKGGARAPGQLVLAPQILAVGRQV